MSEPTKTVVLVEEPVKTVVLVENLPPLKPLSRRRQIQITRREIKMLEEYLRDSIYRHNGYVAHAANSAQGICETHARLLTAQVNLTKLLEPKDPK